MPNTLKKIRDTQEYDIEAEVKTILTLNGKVLQLNSRSLTLGL